MEYARAAPPPKLGSLSRTFNKILRRTVTSSAIDAPTQDDCSIRKLKLSQTFSAGGSNDLNKAEYDKPQQKLCSKDNEAMESILANLFASISAIKAAYAQLQMAQSPYDTDSIQSSDLAIVSELKRISELKHSCFRNQLIVPQPMPDTHMALIAQIEKLRNLIKTYWITQNKLESDLKLMDLEILSLQTKLIESAKKIKALELKLYPGHSLSALDGLHVSGLNSTHFLTVLRFTFKSVRCFVKVMEKQMESAGWDLDAAASAIQPAFHCGKPGYRTLAFLSYVCRHMFADYHHTSYNVVGMEDTATWSRRQFLDEFNEATSVVSHQKLWEHQAISNFFRAKYLSLVHPKMESSFFGNLKHRAAVSHGLGFPVSAFFTGFVEMARRVWLLHCLFFSYEDQSIFQVRPGSRFSDVYMESIAEIDVDATAKGGSATVGFTVVPGFKVGQTLIQCKVCLK